MFTQTTKQSGAGVSPVTPIVVGIALVMALDFLDGCARYPRPASPAPGFRERTLAAAQIGRVAVRAKDAMQPLRTPEATCEYGTDNNAGAKELRRA